MYYKHKLGKDYSARIVNATLSSHAIVDFTKGSKGGRYFNLDCSGSEIRSRHQRVRLPEIMDHPLLVKYPR